MNQSALALPKRLLRIRRQTARLAELRCIRAAAQLEQAVQAERAAQVRLTAADQLLRERCRQMRLVEELQASRHQIQAFSQEVSRLQSAITAARTAYQTAIVERTKADAEVEVLEKLLERRLEEVQRKLEQRKQLFADEWTMRRWNSGDVAPQESER